MDKELKKICVYKYTSIKEVLKQIQKSGKNGAFVIEKDFKLIGIITDSDIRKSILTGKFKKIKCAKDIMTRNFYYVKHNEIHKSHEKLIRSSKILLPILKKKKLISYVHISNLISKKNKRVLIIGGFGFIGSVLSKKLLDYGYQVNILDKNLYGNPFKKHNYGKRLNIILGDCNSKSDLNRSLSGCTDVIHLGELVGDPAVALNTEFSVKNNYEATNLLINECLKRGIERFIFTSSCSVYGFSKKICNENSSLNPVSLYAKCKVACEETILSHTSNIFTPTILRLATAYGPSLRNRFDLVVNKFVAYALKLKEIKIFGEKNWRPLVHVDDITDGIILVLKSPEDKVRNQIFNLGGNTENYKIGYIAEIIKQFYNFKKIIIPQTEDPRSYRVSFDKIKKKLNFKIKKRLKPAIKSMINNFKKKEINLKNPNYFNDQKLKILFKK